MAERINGGQRKEDGPDEGRYGRKAKEYQQYQTDYWGQLITTREAIVWPPE